MPRSTNYHAIVNAGFLYQLNNQNKVISSKIAFGGLSPSFTRATKTERFLVGKQLFSNDTLQTALKVLSDEIVVVENPPEPSVEFRRRLALGLFYKVSWKSELFSSSMKSLLLLCRFVLSRVIFITIKIFLSS